MGTADILAGQKLGPYSKAEAKAELARLESDNALCDLTRTVACIETMVRQRMVSGVGAQPQTEEEFISVLPDVLAKLTVGAELSDVDKNMFAALAGCDPPWRMTGDILSVSGRLPLFYLHGGIAKNPSDFWRSLLASDFMSGADALPESEEATIVGNVAARKVYITALRDPETKAVELVRGIEDNVPPILATLPNLSEIKHTTFETAFDSLAERHIGDIIRLWPIEDVATLVS